MKYFIILLLVLGLSGCGNEDRVMTMDFNPDDFGIWLGKSDNWQARGQSEFEICTGETIKLAHTKFITEKTFEELPIYYQPIIEEEMELYKPNTIVLNSGYPPQQTQDNYRKFVMTFKDYFYDGVALGQFKYQIIGYVNVESIQGPYELHIKDCNIKIVDHYKDTSFDKEKENL